MRTAAGAGIALAFVVAGCTATADGPGSQLPSSPGSSDPATSSSTAGPISTTVPATAAPAGSTRVQFAGPPGRFEPAALTASVGDLVYFLDNTSPGIHTLAIGPALGEILVVSAKVESGDAAVFTAEGLRIGDYVIWCTIGDHAAEGMVGTLTVK